mmetsp:Transcript_23969/g.32787  ORF Transcript_23969/g.32787 Transcript_23969/m.32787 type:complete len:593 (+) Transcript_23969:53-1831(+)
MSSPTFSRRCSMVFLLFCFFSLGFSFSLFGSGRREEEEAPILEKRILRDHKDYSSASLSSLPHLRADSEKARAVKGAMKHAWDSYVKYAWGSDELNPGARRGSNGFGGMGCTIVDSLSTLKIMGLDREFDKGRDWVRDNLHPERLEWVSLFETNIRHLGGLLSAYGLSKDRVLLEKAKEFGERFLPAFHPISGLASNDINLRSGQVKARHSVSLAEIGTLQLEMLYLSYITRDSKFAIPVLKTLRTLDGVKTDINHGLGSQTVDRTTGQYRHDRWTLGAMADSYYEYLIKLHVFTGSNKENGFRRMWDEAAVLMRQHSVRTSGNSLYVGEIHSGKTNSNMDHLACFSGGMFALAGAATGGITEDIEIGDGITRTCVKAYSSTATGIAPEVFQIQTDGSIRPRHPHNLLRPETVESLYVLYRITGDPVYREMGWKIFQAFEDNCRTPNGYAGLTSVERVGGGHDGKQQSFFMAETLKYLYLLFTSSEVISLDEYVFNTEAHPFPIPEKSGWDFVECHFPSIPLSIESKCRGIDLPGEGKQDVVVHGREERERERERMGERERERERGSSSSKLRHLEDRETRRRERRERKLYD